MQPGSAYAEALALGQKLIAGDTTDASVPGVFVNSRDVLAASLDSESAAQTLDVLAGLLVVTRRALHGDLMFVPAVQTRESAAWQVVTRPQRDGTTVASKLVDLYEQRDDEVGQKAADVLLAAIGRSSEAVDDPKVHAHLMATLPDRFDTLNTAITERRAIGESPDLLRMREFEQLKTLSNATVRTLGARWLEDGSPSPLLRGLFDLQLDDIVKDTLFNEVARYIPATESMLTYWGLDEIEIHRAWQLGYGQDTLPDGRLDPKSPTPTQYVAENLRTIHRLEEIEPRTASGLRHFYRIRNFARYDADMLAHMYQHRADHHEQNVVIAVSMADHNGAAYKNKVFRKELYDYLTEQGIGVHIVEFSDESELTELAENWLRERPDEKFQLMVMKAHGKDYSVSGLTPDRFGFLRKREITHRELAASLAVPAMQLTTELADLFFTSCNSGTQPDGTAATMSAATNRRTTGSGGETSLHTFDVKTDGEGYVTGVEALYQVRVRGRGNTWTSVPDPNLRKVYNP